MIATPLEPRARRLAPAVKASARTRRRRLGPRAMKLLRRAHLYTGLALLPWVALYGVTALFFNHADWWSDTRRHEVSAAELAGDALAFLPDPSEVEREAFARLAARAAEQGAAIELVGGSARWLGSVSLNARSDAASARLTLDPAGRGGTLYASPAEGAEARPDWTRAERLEGWAPMDESAREDAAELAPRLAAARGLELESASTRRLPELRILVNEAGRTFACDVGMDGSLEVRPADELASLRQRLLQLHKAHGDPGHAGARRLWALVVDAMGVAMVLWALTGVAMWWSLRPTRLAGTLALASGLAAMAALALAVWRATGSV